MKGHEELPVPSAGPLTLTEPCLLVSLNLDGQAEVCQFHCGPFAFAGQKQVLRLQGESRQGTAFTPRAVVRGGGQNRDGSSLLDREAQCASQHGGPRPIAPFFSGDKDGKPQSFKGKLALSLNLDTLLPKMRTKSPAHPHRQHNSSSTGLQGCPTDRLPVLPISFLTRWRVHGLGQWSS